ncbi:IS110 family transposase [Sinorhizobium medicae]|uniref:IS110 family transposase n=1 Tax=Sinorhizobium medicae TaxID=110321 RepID=UPI001F21F85D|nr:IS110 family transposase [Sinorhizobium medicae]
MRTGGSALLGRASSEADQERGSPQKLVSYFGLNPRVRQSGHGAAHHGRISKIGRSDARAMLVEAAWAAAKRRGRCTPSSSGSEPDAATRSQRSQWLASSRF